MSIQNAFASLAVRDFPSAQKWYERLFGRAADSRPTADLAEWTFAGGGRLQVYRNPDRAGSGTVTLAVGELGEQIAALRRSGIEPGVPIETPMANVVMIADPDGNSIAFAQALQGKALVGAALS